MSLSLNYNDCQIKIKAAQSPWKTNIIKGVKMSTVGTIQSNLTGMEYSPSQLKAGYKLSLEREPENLNDTL
ncbi:MAG: hypothetical protein NT118_05960 [Lentisphaerae bacterium]|nr:hypothetical protein [Lentisphaerota bacterium]